MTEEQQHKIGSGFGFHSTADEVLDFVASNDNADAQAVLVPDTALHTVAWLTDLEERLGKPVLTANQVSVWEGLRLVGETAPRAGLGALFAKG